MVKVDAMIGPKESSLSANVGRLESLKVYSTRFRRSWASVTRVSEFVESSKSYRKVMVRLSLFSIIYLYYPVKYEPNVVALGRR